MAAAQSDFVEVRGFPRGDILKTGVLAVQDVIKHPMKAKIIRLLVIHKERESLVEMLKSKVAAGCQCPFCPSCRLGSFSFYLLAGRSSCCL